MAWNDPKGKPVLGSGVIKTKSDGAWRIGPAYDEDGKTNNTEDLFLSRKYRVNQGIAAGRAVSENMLGLTRRGNRRDVNTNFKGSSIWERAAIGAPIGIGLGIGIKNLWQHKHKFSLPVIPTANNAFIRNVASQLSTLGITPTGEIISELAGLDQTKLNFDAISMAWNSAMQAADPAMMLKRPILNPSNPLSSIEFFAKSNTSLQANKAVSFFLRNAYSMQKHLGVSNMAFAPTMFGKLGKSNFVQTAIGLNDISNSTLQHTLSAIQKEVHALPGAQMNMRLASRPGLEGSQLMVSFSGGKFGAGAMLEIPMEIAGKPGVIAHGISQQSQYIVGQHAIIGPDFKIQSTLKHEEWIAKRFYSELLPKIHGDERLTSRGIRKLVNDFNISTLQGGEWIYNTNSLPNYTAKIALGAHRVNLVNANALSTNIASDKVASVLAANEGILFPSTSPNQLAKGIVSSYNGRNMWLGGEAFPWERRPMQGPGRGIGPTAGSLAARKANPLYKRFGWMRTPELQAMGPNLDLMGRTVFINEKLYPGVAEKYLGGVLGGGGLRSSALSSQMHHQIPLQINLSSKYNISSKLLSTLESNQSSGGVYSLSSPAKFEHGELLGYDMEGHPMHYASNMEITGGYKYTDTGGDYLKLTGRELLHPGQSDKYFGMDKAVLREVPQGNIQEIVRNEIGDVVDPIMGEAHILLTMDTLRKNRSLHNLQMLSALQDYTQQVMNDRGIPFKSWEWMQPHVNKILGGAISHKEVTANIYDLAMQQGLPPSAMGRIFGALPDVDPGLYRDLGFNIHEQAEIERGVVSGVGQYYFGGKSNAGGRGSVEPRIFEMLSAGQFGPLSQSIKSELVSRQVLANPEVVMEQSVLSHALSSLHSGVKSMHGVAEHHISGLNPNSIHDILTSGGIVHLENTLANVNSIYVPGAANSASMRNYVTHTGLEVSSDLSSAYGTFLESAYGTKHGDISRAATEEAYSGLVGALGTAHARTITGKGYGLARREVLGSKYLRAIPGTAEQTGDLYTRGISAKDAETMFADMEHIHRNNPTELEALAEQKSRLFGGGTIGGLTSRDPDIGLYSMSHGRFKILPGLDPGQIVIPQQTRILYDEAGNEVTRVALGSMAGHAGDFDDDNMHAMLTSSSIEKTINNHYTSKNHPELDMLQEQYIIRQQLLKAKAPAEVGITPLEEMIAGTEKLAMAKAKVGPLSLPLSQLRAAVFGSELGIEDKANAASLLEALEQVPISGKWASTKNVHRFGALVDELARGAQAGKGGILANITREIFQDNKVASALLTQDQTFTTDLGTKVNIPALDIDKIGAHISESMRNFGSAKLRRIMAGTTELSSGMIPKYLNYSGGLLSDFKIPTKGINLMGEVMRIKGTMSNKMMAMGGEVIQHAAKPLAIGFGAALGISAILSAPVSTLAPGASAPPVSTGRIRSGNSTGITPENLHPDSSITGDPTIPNTMSRPSARIDPESSAAYHIRVRGTNRHNANIGTIGQGINNMISRYGNRNTTNNINIRDRKTSLTQDRIDSIIRR